MPLFDIFELMKRKNVRQQNDKIFGSRSSDGRSGIIFSPVFGSFGFFEHFFEIAFSVATRMWIHPVDTEIFGDIVLLYLVVGNDNILIEHPVQKDQKYQNTKNNSNPFSQSTFFAKVEKNLLVFIFLRKFYALLRLFSPPE